MPGRPFWMGDEVDGYKSERGPSRKYPCQVLFIMAQWFWCGKVSKKHNDHPQEFTKRYAGLIFFATQLKTQVQWALKNNTYLQQLLSILGKLYKLNLQIAYYWTLLPKTWASKSVLYTIKLMQSEKTSTSTQT